MNKEPVTYRYFWQGIDAQVTKIRSSIKRLNFNPDMIVGISRGGLIPATLLSYMMGLPVCSLQWQRRDLAKQRDHTQLREILLASKTGIVIVDDILDSGETLREIDEYIRYFLGSNELDERDKKVPVRYAVCVKRAEVTSPVPDLIYGVQLENIDWVVFPWGE